MEHLPLNIYSKPGLMEVTEFFIIRPCKIESRFCFQIFSELYARGRKHNTGLGKKHKHNLSSEPESLVNWKIFRDENCWILSIENSCLCPIVDMQEVLVNVSIFFRIFALFSKFRVNFIAFIEKGLCVCFWQNPRKLYARAESKPTFNFMRPNA